MKLRCGSRSAKGASRMVLACAGTQLFAELEKLHSRQNQEAGWGAPRNCCAGIENINRFLSNKWLFLCRPRIGERSLGVKGRSRNCATVLRHCARDLLIATIGEANPVPTHR